jgi:hypothetical protein
VNLREVSYGSCRWPVEVLFDGQGKMYVDAGFEKFAAPTSRRSDRCLLHCLYEGDGDMCVTVFDDSGEDIANNND